MVRVYSKTRTSETYIHTYIHTNMRHLGTAQQALLFEINRRAPKPLHSRTVLLLGHIQYIICILHEIIFF